jgi:hypothetical protein
LQIIAHKQGLRVLKEDWAFHDCRAILGEKTFIRDDDHADKINENDSE